VSVCLRIKIEEPHKRILMEIDTGIFFAEELMCNSKFGSDMTTVTGFLHVLFSDCPEQLSKNSL
jgi:hypothetical protein